LPKFLPPGTEPPLPIQLATSLRVVGLYWFNTSSALAVFFGLTSSPKLNGDYQTTRAGFGDCGRSAAVERRVNIGWGL
jgi:hypothetical protein